MIYNLALPEHTAQHHLWQDNQNVCHAQPASSVAVSTSRHQVVHVPVAITARMALTYQHHQVDIRDSRASALLAAIARLAMQALQYLVHLALSITQHTEKAFPIAWHASRVITVTKKDFHGQLENASLDITAVVVLFCRIRLF